MKEFSVKVVIADDHSAILVGLKHILSTAYTIEIVGTARNSTGLARLLDTHPCDVLITDYAMPGGDYGDGMALLEYIRRRYQNLNIVVMSMMDNPAVLRTLVKLGIRCIVSKSDDSTHLIPAVHIAFSGGTYLSPTIESMLHTVDHGDNGQIKVRELTKRELEIVRLFVSGLGINEIAERLHRSKQTISSQKNSAMRKLGIERDADLFKYAMEIGLLSRSGTVT